MASCIKNFKRRTCEPSMIASKHNANMFLMPQCQWGRMVWYDLREREREEERKDKAIHEYKGNPTEMWLVQGIVLGAGTNGHFGVPSLARHIDSYKQLAKAVECTFGRQIMHTTNQSK